MTEPPATIADKSAEQLRAEFLAVYDKAEAIREKLELLIHELEAHGLAFADNSEVTEPSPCRSANIRDQTPPQDNAPAWHIACEEVFPSTDVDGAYPSP